jgi:hypothetical protein
MKLIAAAKRSFFPVIPSAAPKARSRGTTTGSRAGGGPLDQLGMTGTAIAVFQSI